MEVKDPSAKYLARPRYKQTELGSLPEEWALANLGTMSAFITKGSTPTTHGFSWQQDGVLFLRSECVSKNGLDLSQSMFISEAAHASLRRSEIRDGDILITITGNVGRVVVFKNSASANINQHIARVRIVSSDVDRDFVYHFLSLPQYRARFTSITTGQAYPQISLKQVREAPVPLPPTKGEQEAIAEGLSDADAFVESLEQLLAKKRQVKQGAMQELLTGKKRLPGFSDQWEEKTLGRVAPLQRGFDLPNAKLQRGPFPVVYSNGVLTHHAVSQVKGPEVVTGRSGTIGNVTFVEQDFWPHNTALWVTSFRGNDPKFVFYLFLQIGLERFATGSGVPTLNRNDVHAFTVSIPGTKDEQAAISRILSDMEADVATLEAKLTKARQLKQGMMQELLTGQIRLMDRRTSEGAM